MPSPQRNPASLGPALLVVAAAASQEIGAALAVGLFAATGAVGAVFIRLAVAGVVLGALMRPRLRGLTARAWGSAVALALALVVMNVCFYLALIRIPLGVAVTVESLGPLILSVVVSPRRIAWLWALLAFAGVAVLGLTGEQLALGSAATFGTGFAFAAGAGVAWAGYILASARAGAEFPRLDGLAVAAVIGAVVVAPFAAVSVDAADVLTWRVLGLGLTVGLLSSVIPYSLELLSLRRLSADTFAVLTCLSPVTAALAGLFLLGQHLPIAGYLAIVAVTAASIGAVRTAGAPDTAGRTPPFSG